MINKYKTKPVVIEAMQYINFSQSYGDLSKFVNDHNSLFIVEPQNPQLAIKTLEGNMRISEGDYIIKGLRGEFYPCKPDVFEKKYEKID